jgi:DNA-binding IclR family transcriptional regulator
MVSPSASRTVQILDFLTTHPGRGFTLSELSRQLLLSKATAYRILTELTNHAVLVRSPDSQEYRLGPALAAMGAVAERSFPALNLGKREAQRLADRHDAECVLLMPTEDEILVIGRSGVPGPMSFATYEGQRHPLLPPLGTIFLAWKSDDEIEAWLDRSGDQLSEEERDYYRRAILVDRRRGYNLALEVESLFDLYELYTAGNPYTPEGRQKIRRGYGTLAHHRGYLVVTDNVHADAALSSISAPVFSPDGGMLFAITLLLTGTGRRAGDAPRLARALTRAAARVMTGIDGRHPSTNARAAPRGQGGELGGREQQKRMTMSPHG